MRIALVSNWYPPDSYAGSGIYVHGLAQRLAACGHDVSVLYSRDAYRFKAAGRSQEGLSHDPRVRVVALHSRLGPLAPIIVHQTGRPRPYRRQLLEFFREPFDVIHYNNISLLGGPGIYRWGEGLKLAMQHDAWLVCPLSTLYRYNRMLCSAEKPPCTRCSLVCGKPPQPWRWTGLLQREAEHVDRFISPSEHMIALLRERGFDRPMAYLPYLADPIVRTDAAPQGEAGGPPCTQPYFLFVGRLEKTKGLQDVISAFRKRAGEAHLLIAGGGTYRAALERMAAGHPRIRFLGYLSQDALKTYYRHCLGLIVPSVWYENVAITLLDALRLGAPVIARDLAGPGEFTRKSGGGLLFTNEEELLAALEELERSPETRARLRQNGTAYFRREHTAEVHLARYFALIDSLKGASTR